VEKIKIKIKINKNKNLKFKKKNPVNKNQAWEPIHQKYKAKENTSKHNPKKKQK